MDELEIKVEWPGKLPRVNSIVNIKKSSSGEVVLYKILKIVELRWDKTALKPTICCVVKGEYY